VLLGTLYPLFLDALDLGKISVGAPYFESVFAPLMLPVLLLMAAAPFVEWKSAKLRPVLERVSRVAQASLLFGLAAWLTWKFSLAAAGGLMLAVWILLGTALHLVQRLAEPGEGVSFHRHLAKQPLSYWGMLAAHAGIAVFVAGVTLVKSGEVSEDASMRVGDSIVSNGWRYSFTALQKVDGPNYIAARATFEVRDEGGRVLVLQPEKRYYTVQQMPMTEAAIDRGFTRDIYLSLGEPGKDGTWLVRMQRKPFIGWIWAGCLIIAGGGLLAAADRRYRLRKRAAATAPAGGRVATAS
jgi:cytochrome c-type biogenesis protein CcmF